MIILKSSEEIGIMREANRIAARVLEFLSDMARPGAKTMDMDRAAEDFIVKNGAAPAFKGYLGYEHTLCTSINEQIVHGIPGEDELGEGDIISIDCGVYYKGFYGDHAWTYAVGRVDAESKRLLDVGERALYRGIEMARVGNRLYDISAAIQECVESNGFSVVRDYVGHGVGRKLHEEPQVPNFGVAGTGVKLRQGLVLALEPMVNAGTWKVRVLQDGWTVVTEDGKKSAHFEHSIAILSDGPEILSRVD